MLNGQKGWCRVGRICGRLSFLDSLWMEIADNYYELERLELARDSLGMIELQLHFQQQREGERDTTHKVHSLCK